MTGKRFTSEHDQSGQDGLLNKEMDRRSFLGKTTKMAGVALGASLLGPLNALPARRCFTFVDYEFKWSKTRFSFSCYQ